MTAVMMENSHLPKLRYGVNEEEEEEEKEEEKGQRGRFYTRLPTVEYSDPHLTVFTITLLIVNQPMHSESTICWAVLRPTLINYGLLDCPRT